MIFDRMSIFFRKKKNATKKFGILIVLIGLITVPVIPTSANSGSMASSVLTGTFYDDYVSGDYWSEDILWSIEKGLIQGYRGVPHPSGGRVGNWLNPYGELTEAQMITILFRYFYPTELVNIPTDSTFFASPAYILAKKYHLNVDYEKSNAYNTATRGELAQSLVSLYFGKQITTRQAVQFMYDANLSTGLADENGGFPKTYKSYGVYNELKRSHIVSFMKRFDGFVKSGKKIPLPAEVNGEVPIAPPVKTKLMDDYNFTVNYGKHYYGIPWYGYFGTLHDYPNQSEYMKAMQAQYDQVMEIIYNELETGYHEVKIGGSAEPYYLEFLDGARWDGDRTNRSERNIALAQAAGAFRHYIEYGFTKEEIIKLQKTLIIANRLMGSKGDDWSATSAYELLVNGISNNNARQDVFQAVFDAMGYNTMQMLKPRAVITLVELNGKWLYPYSHTFYEADVYDMYFGEGNYMIDEPTYGEKPEFVLKFK